MLELDEIAVFWDYDNCPVPASVSGHRIVKSIAKIIGNGRITSFKAYTAMAGRDTANKFSELQTSAISIIHCPLNGKKDVVDQMLMVDMVIHGMLHPSIKIVLISGDRDFAYALGKMNLQGHKIMLITLDSAHQSLKEQAHKCVYWRDIIGFANTVDTTLVPDMECMKLDSDAEPDAICDEELCEEPDLSEHSDNSNSEYEYTSEVEYDANLTRPHTPNNRLRQPRCASPPSTSPGKPRLSPMTPGKQYNQPAKYDYDTVILTPPSSTFSKKLKHGSNISDSLLPSALEHKASITVVPTRATKDRKYSHFHILIRCLQDHARRGSNRPLRSAIGSQISLGGITYAQVGVRKFSEYTALAEKEGIIRLGGTDGLAWISLEPAWRSVVL